MKCEQIFCKPIESHILCDFLTKITYENNGSYLVGLHAYKKLLFHELQSEFRELLRPYYHKSKQFYIDRELTYKSFITIIRQICKYNSIRMISQVKYIESVYTNEYTIFMDNG